MSDKSPSTVRGGPRNCWCLTCWPVNMIHDPSSMRMALCPDCGNKRCPKANNCANACTGSNEVGQAGSSWEHVSPIIEKQTISATDSQVGGDHYRAGAIQPVEYIEANALPFLEGCVVKRVTRHARQGGKGRQGIEKAIHELQLLLQLRYGNSRPVKAQTTHIDRGIE